MMYPQYNKNIIKINKIENKLLKHMGYIIQYVWNHNNAINNFWTNPIYFEGHNNYGLSTYVPFHRKSIKCWNPNLSGIINSDILSENYM
jgi:hypothetical protein